MISFKEVMEIHDSAIIEFGGKNNIRDISLLESALNRPFVTFDGIDLYPTVIDKIAAVTESLIKNHPFHDGNKRIGYIIMRLLLRKNNLDIFASQDEKYLFIISIAEGKLDYDAIVEWLKSNTKPIND